MVILTHMLNGWPQFSRLDISTLPAWTRMPSAPLRACTHAGCGARQAGSRCPVHARVQRQEADANRAHVEWRKWYRREPWVSARLRFLGKNPLCVDCQQEGVTKAATVVDHEIPHKGVWARFIDETNWRARCKPHHDRKTATQDGGFGR